MGIAIKSKEQVRIMERSGKSLAQALEKLEKAVIPGRNAYEIDLMAEELIRKAGATPSFKTVPGYSWATCINVNEGVVHGIPKKELVFKKEDIVSLDLGMYKDGFHVDASTSFLLGRNQERQEFLRVGRSALGCAIDNARIGNRIKDISFAIESTLKAGGCVPVKALVGHGVGRELHEEPLIPCFVTDSKDEKILLREGYVLAIEVIYTQGLPELVLDNDGWTIRTKDGKISGLFEETVAITKNGPLVLTKWSQNNL